MAKGASTEKTLGRLHSLLANVYIKILTKYADELDAPKREVTADDLMAGLEAEGIKVNPGILAGCAKFLKDNEIMFDSEEIAELNSLQRRLEDKQKNRERTINLSNIPLVDMNSA